MRETHASSRRDPARHYKTAANDWDDLLDSTEVTLIGASTAEAILQLDIVLVYEICEDSLGYPVDELEALSEAVDKPILFTVPGPYEALRHEREQMESSWRSDIRYGERGAQAVAALIESISGEE
ncbi:hypothetical protein [Natrinema soli]|uniref:Uncharacterized protein n=1 Tax=Natrinema soli TaxID=1930624 RepID=A0ABD5SK69_9EURY